MQTVTRRTLTRDANQRLRQGDLDGALKGLIALVRSAPHDFDARLRIGDGLLAAGDVRGAIEVYGALVRETAHAGYPLKACVALKVLGGIDPNVNEVFRVLADRYAQGSPSLGKAVRVGLPDGDAEVPANAFLAGEVKGAVLYDAARRVATSREGLPRYPETVAPVPLLSELPPDAFARMLAAVELTRAPAATELIREGALGDAFYMLARGSAEVTRGPERLVLATPGEGCVLGEMALVSSSPRTATVTTREDSDVLVFGRDAIRAVSREIRVVEAALERFMRQRVLSNLMATHALFKPFDPAQRVQLMSYFTAREFSAGAVIIREGDEGHGLYLVLSGEVTVSALRDGRDSVEVTRLGAGDVFGEISLLRDAPTNATVTAARETHGLFLDRGTFARLVAGVPALRQYFEDIAEDRAIATRVSISSLDEIDVLL